MGETLRLLRIFYGYKSVEMARKLELSQSYVSELENNKKQPSLEILDKYARVFGIKKSTLILFSEALDNEGDKDAKHSVAKAGMILLKILEREGNLDDE